MEVDKRRVSQEEGKPGKQRVHGGRARYNAGCRWGRRTRDPCGEGDNAAATATQSDTGRHWETEGGARRDWSKPIPVGPRDGLPRWVTSDD